MIARTGLMLFVLLGATIIAAYAVWFGFKARQGWIDARDDIEGGEPGWMILGGLCLVACLVALMRLAYTLAAR